MIARRDSGGRRECGTDQRGLVKSATRHVRAQGREGNGQSASTPRFRLQMGPRDTPPTTFFSWEPHDFAIVALGLHSGSSGTPGLYMSLSRRDRSMDLRGPRRNSTRSRPDRRSRITRWREHLLHEDGQRIEVYVDTSESGAPTRKRLRASPRLPSSTASAEPGPQASYEVSALQGEPFDQGTRSAGKRRRRGRPAPGL